MSLIIVNAMRNKVKTNFKLGIYCRDIELYPYFLSSYWMKKEENLGCFGIQEIQTSQADRKLQFHPLFKNHFIQWGYFNDDTMHYTTAMEVLKLYWNQKCFSNTLFSCSNHGYIRPHLSAHKEQNQILGLYQSQNYSHQFYQDVKHPDGNLN